MNGMADTHGQSEAHSQCSISVLKPQHQGQIEPSRPKLLEQLLDLNSQTILWFQVIPIRHLLQIHLFCSESVINPLKKLHECKVDSSLHLFKRYWLISNAVIFYHITNQQTLGCHPLWIRLFCSERQTPIQSSLFSICFEAVN